jgi:TRAP-type mannitol/chloroaromatic compound transport system permease large subunit
VDAERVFDLMVERTYGAMNNESLISIPLFVLMGYVMERGRARRQDVLQHPARVPPGCRRRSPSRR